MTEPTKPAAATAAGSAPPAASPADGADPGTVPAHVIIGGLAILLAAGYLVFDLLSGGKATAFVLSFIGRPAGDGEPPEGG